LRTRTCQGSDQDRTNGRTRKGIASKRSKLLHRRRKETEKEGGLRQGYDKQGKERISQK
jgi:hypothetical protein